MYACLGKFQEIFYNYSCQITVSLVSLSVLQTALADPDRVGCFNPMVPILENFVKKIQIIPH